MELALELLRSRLALPAPFGNKGNGRFMSGRIMSIVRLLCRSSTAFIHSVLTLSSPPNELLQAFLWVSLNSDKLARPLSLSHSITSYDSATHVNATPFESLFWFFRGRPLFLSSVFRVFSSRSWSRQQRAHQQHTQLESVGVTRGHGVSCVRVSWYTRASSPPAGEWELVVRRRHSTPPETQDERGGREWGTGLATAQRAHHHAKGRGQSGIEWGGAVR